MVATGWLDKNKEAEAASVDMASRLQDTYEGKISDYRYPSYFDAVVNEGLKSIILTAAKKSWTTAIVYRVNRPELSS